MTPLWQSLPTGPAATIAMAVAGSVPVLNTARLRLRPPTLADYPSYAEIATAPRGRFINESGTEEDAWYGFCEMVAGWLLRGTGLWAVERVDRELIGFVVVGVEHGDPERELGYMLLQEHEEQGYGAEAVAAARTYALETLGFETLVSYVDARNERSAALAERVGGRRDPNAMCADAETLVYRYERTTP